jgi:hypothetical protein
MQVVITDSLWPGKFLGFWARLGAPHPLVMLASQPFPPGTCFTTAVHAALMHGNSIYARWAGAHLVSVCTWLYCSMPPRPIQACSRS